MSSWSHRYVRWFGTRLPITSRTLLYIVVFISSVVASTLLFSLAKALPVVLHLAIAVPMALAVHLIFLEIERLRLDAPVTAPELLQMEERVNQRAVVPVSIELWERNSPDPFIVSTFNLRFNAVVVSTPMVQSMVEMSASGEVLLAYHMLRMPRSRWVWDLLGSILVFCGINVFLEMFAYPLLDSLYWGFFGWLYAVVFSGAMIIIFPVIGFMIRGAFWRHDAAFEIVNELYGMHPQVAKLQVERGRELDSDETRAVLWGVLEWEKRKRSGRRIGVALISIFSGIFVYALGAIAIGFIYVLYLTVLGFVPLAAVVFGFVTYFIIRQWDKRAMKEIEYATEGAREPIWMD